MSFSVRLAVQLSTFYAAARQSCRENGRVMVSPDIVIDDGRTSELGRQYDERFRQQTAFVKILD